MNEGFMKRIYFTEKSLQLVKAVCFMKAM